MLNISDMFNWKVTVYTYFTFLSQMKTHLWRASFKFYKVFTKLPTQIINLY